MFLVAYLTSAGTACAQTPPAPEPVFDRVIADFEDDSLDRWQSSMSGEYYRGGQGQKGLSIVRDEARNSRVLAAQVRWKDAQASEPAFITRFLPEPIPRYLITSVSFAYRLSAYHLDDVGGFRVRLRYSDTEFTDYEVSTGRPLPVGEWQTVTLDTRPGPNVRNIYSTLFGSVREITFRLDDADTENAEFELRLDDLKLTMRSPAEEHYTPQATARPTDDRLAVLYLKHSAEGFFPLEDAVRFAASTFGERPPRVDTHLFRGLHFPFFDFPPARDDLLAYDLIVMLDVDPYVLTWPQATWIADAVASGAGLLFVAGPNTLAHSKDFKAPIAAILPVTFEPDAKDRSGGAATIPLPDHPAVAGLDPDRLGRIGQIAAVAPRAGAQVALQSGGQPLLVLGEIGSGRTALLASWPQISAPRDRCFFADDCSEALFQQLVLWLLNDQPPVRVAAVTPPPRTVIGAGEVECGLDLRSPRAQRVTVRWSSCQPGDPIEDETVTIDGSAPVSRRFSLLPPRGPQLSVEMTATVLDQEGKPLAERRFRTQVLSPIVLIGYARYGRLAFAPGWPVQVGAELSMPNLPRAIVSGAGATVSSPDGAWNVGLPTMADVWAYKPGTDHVYHSFSGGEVLSESRSSAGLLPILTTEALIRATRTDGNIFDADNRIATVRRTLAVRPGGAVSLTYDYEFVRDVRLQRLPLLLTLPVSRWAGTPFRLRCEEGEYEGVLPPEEDPNRDEIADVHGLDLALETPGGPVRIQWQQPGLRAWIRDLRKYGIADYRIELECPFAGAEAKAGDTYSVVLTITFPTTQAEAPPLDGLTVSARLRGGEDFAASTPIWDIGSARAAAQVRLSGVLPNLESGPCWVEFALGKPGAEPVATDAFPCWIVDNLDRERFFPLISILGTSGGGHQLDEAGVRARVDDLFRVGFNTIAYGGATRFARDHVTDLAPQIDAYAEGYAFSRGMASILEYTNYTRLSREGQGDPGPFAPTSMEATRAHVQPYLDVADANPRLLSVKVIDEPVAAENSLTLSDDEKRVFAERYGGELRPLKDIGDDPLARLHLAQFIGDRVAEQYRQGYEIKHERDRRWDLLLTYMSPGLGYGRSFSGQEDALKWSRYADRIDFDVYPYFYPTSQKLRMVQANYCHAFQRGIAQHLGKPFGFYVELDDRNYPFQINPPEASAECAYTAIGQGVTYLNSFINQAFATGCQSRPERWEHLAGELPRIRRIGPLLNKLQRPPAPVALLYPMIQAKIRNGYPVPHYTFALLNSAFGGTDLLHEEVLLETGIPKSCRALVLLRTELLARRTFEAILAFVEQGGLVIADGSLPATDETGAPLEWPTGLAAGQAIEAPGLGVPVRLQRLGQGVVLCLEADVESLVKGTVEGADPQSPEIADPVRFRLWHELIRSLFDGSVTGAPPIQPAAVADDDTAQIEVGVRTSEDTTLLVVTNHDSRQRTATLRLPILAERPGFLCDLREMRPLDGGQLTVNIAGRHSALLGLYPERPTGVGLQLKRARVKPGEELAYEITVRNEQGQPARGLHLVEVTVTDASGTVRERYGGGFAVAGTLEFHAPLATNAARGEWRLEARLPVIAQSASATLTVR